MPSTRSRARAALCRGGGAQGLAARTWVLLAVLIAVQEALVLLFAFRGPHHNGWLFFQGGDQIWYSTGASLLAQLELPYALVSYGWTLVLVPLSVILGTSYLQLLPATVVIGVLVLLPAALVLVFAIGREFGGRWFGLWAASLWVAAPWVSILFFEQRYHDRWVDQFLPQALGLTSLADLPSLVCLLAAAYLVLRSICLRNIWVAVTAGLVVGFAGGMKPANLVFLAGPALAYPLARQWRNALLFAVALTPALITLAIWKARGLGSIPAFSLPGTDVAAGVEPPAIGAQALDRYAPLDWGVFSKNIADLRDHLSGALVWITLPFVGALALARRSLPATGLLLGWFLGFALVKGSAPQSTVDSGSFFRLLMPAWPAYLLLVAAVPLWLPGLRERLVEPALRGGSPSWRGAAAAGVLLGLVPLLWIAASGTSGNRRQAVQSGGILSPVSNDLGARARAFPGGVRVTWNALRWHSDVLYYVYRFDGPEDVTCEDAGVQLCTFRGTLLGSTRRREFVDATGRAPDATYRVGVGASWLGPGGDIALFSPPLRAEFAS